MNWDKLLLEISGLIISHEDYNQRLGELAYLAHQERGPAAYEDIAKFLEDQGTKYSPKTLKNKAWVYKNTQQLELPMDIGYGLRQEIASLNFANQKKFMQMIADGYSQQEVIRLIKKFKGIEPKAKICPHCGGTL